MASQVYKSRYVLTSAALSYEPRSIVRVDAKLRMTTVLMLPDTEEILDFVCGDKTLSMASSSTLTSVARPELHP